MNKKLIYFLAIFLPVLVIAAWALQFTAISLYGEKVQLRITGYDPRDLLAGHYLRYRVDFGSLLTCSSDTQTEKCVCLKPDQSTGISQAAWVGACTQRTSQEDCNHWLKVKCRWSQLSTSIDRFYIPETQANLLRTVPANSTIEVHLNGRGQGIVTNLLVNGEPLVTFLEHQAK